MNTVERKKRAWVNNFYPRECYFGLAFWYVADKKGCDSIILGGPKPGPSNKILSTTVRYVRIWTR